MRKLRARWGHFCFLVFALALGALGRLVGAATSHPVSRRYSTELSPAQRAEAIQRRKELWEVLHPESARNPRTLTGRGNIAFSADTEKATGESKRRLQEHLARAEALGPDIHAVVGTSLDKGVELDALVKMKPEERRDLVRRAQAGEQVSAKHHNESKKDPQQASRMVAIIVGWPNRALLRLRTRFWFGLDFVLRRVQKRRHRAVVKQRIRAVLFVKRLHFRAKRSRFLRRATPQTSNHHVRERLFRFRPVFDTHGLIPPCGHHDSSPAFVHGESFIGALWE